MLCAEIAIAKVANPLGPVNAGDDIGFDITVTNDGTGTATDVHVVDELPDGFDWVLGAVTGDADCSITGAPPNGEVLVCDDDALPAGASFSVHVSATSDAADCGIVNNTASVATGNDGSGEASASVTINCPDLEVVKDGNGPINGGEDAVFTITLTNHGPGDASDVTLEDQLPAGTWTLGGADAAACEIDGSNLLTCDFGTVESGGHPHDHAHPDDDRGELRHRSSTRSPSAPRTSPTTTSSRTTDDATIVVNCPDVAVEKTADPARSVPAKAPRSRSP